MVKPLSQISSDGNLYLIAFSKYDDDERVYSIDKLKSVMISEKTNIKVTDRSMAKLSKKIAFMLLDDSIKVKLYCDRSILDYVIEQFEEVRIKVDTESKKYFFVTVPDTSFFGAKYWTLQYSSFCEVLEPRNLREDVIKTLNEAVSIYDSYFRKNGELIMYDLDVVNYSKKGVNYK